MKKNNKDINYEILKEVRKQNRENEIREFGKQIFFKVLIQRDKTKYTRKQKHKSVL